MLEPVRVGKASAQGTWTEYLVLFLRIMAAVSLINVYIEIQAKRGLVRSAT